MGPGGTVEIDNSDAVPIEVTVVGGGGGGGDASEATLATRLSEATFVAEDFATEATLEAARALLAGTVAVSAAALPLPAGAATQATLAALLAQLIAEDFATEATVEAVRALLAAGIVVTGTFWQAVQPVSGPLTDTQLRAAVVPVNDADIPDLTGTPAYDAKVSGTISVPADGRVTGIAAHATTAGTLTIAGGASIPIPANGDFTDGPEAQWVGPLDIVATGTDAFYVRWVI